MIGTRYPDLPWRAGQSEASLRLGLLPALAGLWGTAFLVAIRVCGIATRFSVKSVLSVSGRCGHRKVGGACASRVETTAGQAGRLLCW